MNKIAFTLYLDESGDDLLHTSDVYNSDSKIETHCTLLGAVIPHDKLNLLKEELKSLKLSIFRSHEIILHNVDIRFKRGTFAIFYYQPEIYKVFKSQINQLTNKIRPTIICSSLDKKLWVELYPRKLHFEDDPYEQALVYLLERYAHFLNTQIDDCVGHIVVETRGDIRKNKRLELIYQDTKDSGTQYHRSAHFAKLADKIEFHKKSLNIPGLQLADYFAYPFYVNHKYPKRDNEHYDFLRQFVYPGNTGMYGHKKWPV